MVMAAPTRAPVLASRVLQAFAGCLLTPAIAALTLMLCGHEAFSERLGSNGRYASLGNGLRRRGTGWRRLLSVGRAPCSPSPPC